MFTIALVGEKNEIIDSVFYRRFKIVVGDFVETILSPLSFWSVDDYVYHWREQLTKFIQSDQDKTFLITEMHNPETANFIRWWVVYREEDSVYFQEQLIFLDELEGKFSIEDAASFINDRQTVNEDGDEISEWEINFYELAVSPLLKLNK